MAVDIEFYNVDATTSLISLDKVTGGINLGVIKKNQQEIVPVIIKNNGTNDANNVYVQGSQLNDSSTVSINEYTNETFASKWKTFSLLPDGLFSSTLTLPNIKAGTTMVGLIKYTELFTNPASSSWTNDVFTNHTFSWSGNSVKLTSATGTGDYYARMDADGWGNNKDIDFTVQFIQPASQAPGGAFTMFGLRQNCLGDGKGYIICLKRTTTVLGGGTCFFEVRKGAGITTAGGYDFGTVTASTIPVNWIDFMDIRLKLITNINSLPELKIWTNNVADTDAPNLWGTPAVSTPSWTDNLNTYPYAGKITAIFGSGGVNIVGADYYQMRSAILITSDIKGKVYIKSAINDGAQDTIIYNSAMELFYDLV